MKLSEEIKKLLKKHQQWFYGDALNYVLPKIENLERENSELKEKINIMTGTKKMLEELNLNSENEIFQVKEVIDNTFCIDEDDNYIQYIESDPIGLDSELLRIIREVIGEKDGDRYEEEQEKKSEELKKWRERDK